MSQFPAYPWKSKMKEHSGITQVLLHNVRAKWKPRILLAHRASESQRKDKSVYGKGKTHDKCHKIHKKTINTKATWKCEVSLLKIIYLAIHHGLGFLYNTHSGITNESGCHALCYLTFRNVISLLVIVCKVSCPQSLSFSMFLKTLTKIQKPSEPRPKDIFCDSHQKSPLE